MFKVVFDTVIFVKALLDPRSFCGRLLFKYSKDYRLFLSPPVVEKILEVLSRKEIIDRFHLRQTNYLEAMSRLLKSMQRAETIVLGETPAVSRDPNDDKFLATAIQAEADYLVSEDRDLLDMKEYKKIKIVSAEAFLGILEENNL